MTSDINVTWSLTTDPYSSELQLLTHDDIWTPEVTQRVATLILLMIVTLVGNVVVIARLATCRFWNSSRLRRRPSRVNVFIVNLAVGDLTVCCFTMTTEVLFVVFEEGWVLGPIACKVLLYLQVGHKQSLQTAC